jgi:tRNA (guanine37-N1)-methyltransferase
MTKPNLPWTATVLTLMPEAYPGLLGVSLLGTSLKQGLWNLDIVNIRDFALDKHASVDAPAFGGGPGMVMRPDVVNRSLESAFCERKPQKILYLSPRGRKITQTYVQELAKQDHIGLLCGRFEGVDQRVLDAWDVEEVSLGDFVLAGGDVAAMALIEAIVRLLPGVLGSEASLEEESFASGLLEYPHYTRPQNWEGREVPEVLRSGHHEKIRAWRRGKAEELTKARRPDLWENYVKSRSKAEV